MLYAIGYLLLEGVGIWGINIPVGLGLRHRQLRLVDRHRPRRHADLGHPAAAAPEVAHVDQPLRRGDDAVRRRLRRPVSAVAHGPAVVLLLAVPLSQHDGAVAAVPQPAGLGRVRRHDLLHRVAAVLVRRPDPRPGDAARPREEPARAGSSTASWRWAGAARRCHWQRYETAYLLLAGLATPLVVSVHTVVSFDFAVAILPGWHSTIFPPYFVAGAIYSGFAMVLTLAIPLRAFYGLQDFITAAPPGEHGQDHAGDRPDRRLRLRHRGVHGLVQRQQLRAVQSASTACSGPYAAFYWALIACNVARPAGAVVQRASAATPPLLFVVALVVNCRHVAGALRHRRHQPAPRLPAVVVGHVLADRLGLGARSSARSGCSSPCCSCSSASCR